MGNKEQDPALEPALKDVESIQSLDTARMALRWALERMRALERRVDEVERDSKQAADSAAKAAAELDAARDLLNRRATEAAERERYYAKVEEYLNLKLEGGLDPAALAQRETRLEAREAELQRREVETEAKVADARRRAEAELRRLTAEAAASADARVEATRSSYEDRMAARDREMSERLIALHEKESQLNALERSLAERRQRFEEFHAAQRAALDREAKSINDTSADQAEFLERRVEQALALRASALERAAQNDKASLLEELATWRAKAREHLPELLESQRRAAHAEDKLARIAEENVQLQQLKATLTEELTRWRSEAQNDLPALLATVRRAVEAEEEVKNLEVELASAQHLAEEYRGQLMSEELSRQGRIKELSRLEAAVSAKLRDAEQDIFRQYDAWLVREEELRRRDQDWRLEAETRQEAVDAMRAEIVAQRRELTQTIAAYRAKAEAIARDGQDHAEGNPR
jgi:chromosome segregation ATPase